MALVATPSHAAPGIAPGQSACTSLGGQFAGVSDGWWCTDPAAASVDSVNEPVLVAACDGDYWATVLDDGIGSISFRCTYLSD